MHDIARRLRIKYKLKTEPTDDQIEKWIRHTDRYINENIDPEEAGRRAARDVLPPVDEYYVAKAESDTLRELLRAARNR